VTGGATQETLETAVQAQGDTLVMSPNSTIYGRNSLRAYIENAETGTLDFIDLDLPKGTEVKLVDVIGGDNPYTRSATLIARTEDLQHFKQIKTVEEAKEIFEETNVAVLPYECLFLDAISLVISILQMTFPTV